MCGSAAIPVCHSGLRPTAATLESDMAKTRLDELVPALVKDGRLDPRHADLLARYWDERDSEAANLEAIGYWLTVCQHARDEQGPMLP
jgi:hypothetical protein